MHFVKFFQWTREHEDSSVCVCVVGGDSSVGDTASLGAQGGTGHHRRGPVGKQHCTPFSAHYFHFSGTLHGVYGSCCFINKVGDQFGVFFGIWYELLI